MQIEMNRKALYILNGRNMPRLKNPLTITNVPVTSAPYAHNSGNILMQKFSVSSANSLNVFTAIP